MRDYWLVSLRLAGCTVVASALSACVIAEDGNRDHSKNRPSSTNAMSESDMAAYCRGEASAEFGVRPQDITTLPVEKSGTAFIVYGEYAEGAQTRTFQCTFDGQGRFQSVRAG